MRILIFISFVFCCFSNVSAVTFKCWTNDEGIRECGNSIPPKYVKQRIEFHSAKSGTLSNVKEASKTEEQVLAEEKARKQQAIEQAEIKKQQAYDDVLLKTYLNVDDLLLSLNWKITTLDSQITLEHGTIRGHNERFLYYSKQAADIERTGKAIPESIQQDLQQVRNKIDKTKQKIEKLKQDKADIRQKFSHDIDRFTIAKMNGLATILKDEEKADELLIVSLSCNKGVSCERLWAKAKSFVDANTSLDIAYDTDIVYTTISPVKMDDIAMIVSKVSPSLRAKNENIALNIRCFPSKGGEAVCATEQVKSYLRQFKRL